MLYTRYLTANLLQRRCSRLEHRPNVAQLSPWRTGHLPIVSPAPVGPHPRQERRHLEENRAVGSMGGVSGKAAGRSEGRSIDRGCCWSRSSEVSRVNGTVVSDKIFGMKKSRWVDRRCRIKSLQGKRADANIRIVTIPTKKKTERRQP